MSLDPLSLQGICRALESGLVAAHSIQALWKRDTTALHTHAQFLDETFANYLRERDHHYGREKRWPDSIFWRRRTNPDSSADRLPITTVSR